MAQTNGIPAARRALFALPAVTGAGPGNAGPEPVTGPVTPFSASASITGNTGVVVPMTLPERSRHAVAHWAGTAANGAGQLWLHPGRLVHGFYNGKPGSLAEHRAYVKSREWVPPELGGKAATVIAFAGIIYHLLIARPLKAAALTVSASADRPLRLAGLTAFLGIAFLLLPHYL